MSDYQTIATGLRFPEGPIALPNGNIVVVEIARGTLTEVSFQIKSSNTTLLDRLLSAMSCNNIHALHVLR